MVAVLKTDDLNGSPGTYGAIVGRRIPKGPAEIPEERNSARGQSDLDNSTH